MISHDELLDNVAVYALGLLPESEAAAVVEHLRTCQSCRKEYELLRPAVTAVAYSSETVASPLLKARIMKQVRGKSARPRSYSWPAYAFAAACLVVALVTGMADLSLRARMASQQQMVADMMAPDAQHYRFGHGEVVARSGRLYIAMPKMPPPPPGHVYQAWTMPKGSTKVAPSMTFEPTGDATVVRLPENAETVALVAVSVEPMGGSQQPTTTPIATVRI